MVKIAAVIAVMVAAAGVALGNYWYTYGLWPRSWWAFVGFLIANIVVTQFLDALRKGDGV
jgi:hypothetical protein